MNNSKIKSLLCIVLAVLSVIALGSACKPKKDPVIGEWATDSGIILNVLESGRLVCNGSGSLNGNGTWDKTSDKHYIVIFEPNGYPSTKWEMLFTDKGTLEIQEESNGGFKSYSFHSVKP